MNEQDKKVIMNAVLNGSLENVQDILKKHTLVMDRSFFDYQLLKAALCRKHHAITNFLLDEGCRIKNPKEINLKEESLLHLAVKLNNEIIIKKILLKGASIYDTDHEGNMPICKALQIGHFCAVDEILNYCCSLEDLNPKNDCDVIHFHVALIVQKITSVKLFLEFGFDINGPLNREVLCCYAYKLQMVHKSLRSNNYCSPSLNLEKYLATNESITILQLEILLYSHKSVQFLLNHGSDINIEDSKGTDLFFLMKWANLDDSSLSYNHTVSLFKIIFTHVQKLLALKLYVNEKVQRSCRLLRSFINILSMGLSFERIRNDQIRSTISLLDNVYNNCIEELGRMKLTKIDNYTSLYSILIKDSRELSKYARNTTLNEIIDFQDLHKDFPLYSDFLKMQFRKGFLRNKLLKFAKATLIDLIGLNLPDLCYDLILKNLTNNELIDFKSAVLLKSTSKRKLCVNNLSLLESKIKLQKQVES